MATSVVPIVGAALADLAPAATREDIACGFC
jgi:hypothetical protein